MDSEEPPILRPIPRRAFEVTLASAESTAPSTPSHDTPPNPNLLDARLHGNDATFNRSRSILNLTSSTLFGIYSRTGYGGEREESSTPWGTGAETPNRRTSTESSRPAPQRPQLASSQHPIHLTWRNFFLLLVLRSTLLFIFGVGYGVLVAHLHDNHHLAPVRVEGFWDRHDWQYLAFWGLAGIALGSLLPWVDLLFGEKASVEGDVGSPKTLAAQAKADDVTDQPSIQADVSLGADWNPAVRSIGAFIGIAFAIRKLPWASTLQVSLTLALANPVLWYLLDRSKPGFLLSTIVGLAGTASLLLINPDVVPSPATTSTNPSPFTSSELRNGSKLHAISAGPLGLVNAESIGVGTWIASVLFCSCVCFGNIGRRLALKPTR